MGDLQDLAELGGDLEDSVLKGFGKPSKRRSFRKYNRRRTLRPGGSSRSTTSDIRDVSYQVEQEWLDNGSHRGTDDMGSVSSSQSGRRRGVNARRGHHRFGRVLEKAAQSKLWTRSSRRKFGKAANSVRSDLSHAGSVSSSGTGTQRFKRSTLGMPVMSEIGSDWPPGRPPGSSPTDSLSGVGSPLIAAHSQALMQKLREEEAMERGMRQDQEKSGYDSDDEDDIDEDEEEEEGEDAGYGNDITMQMGDNNESSEGLRALSLWEDRDIFAVSPVTGGTKESAIRRMLGAHTAQEQLPRDGDADEDDCDEGVPANSKRANKRLCKHLIGEFRSNPNQFDLSLSGHALHRVQLGGLVNDPYHSGTRLRYLYLSNNLLRRVPKKLTTFQSLSVLKLNHNRLTYKSFPDMSQLVNLRVLTANHNKIKVFPPMLATLPGLERLDLHANQIESLLPFKLDDGAKEFATMMSATLGQSLRALDLGMNNLSGTLEGQFFENVLKLEHLNIHTNQLTALPEVFQHMDKLSILLAKGNPLSSPPSSVVSGGCAEVRRFLTSLTEGRIRKEQQRLRKMQSEDHLPQNSPSQKAAPPSVASAPRELEKARSGLTVSECSAGDNGNVAEANELGVNIKEPVQANVVIAASAQEGKIEAFQERVHVLQPPPEPPLLELGNNEHSQQQQEQQQQQQQQQEPQLLEYEEKKSPTESQHQRSIKVVVLGHQSSGKTSLIKRLVQVDAQQEQVHAKEETGKSHEDGRAFGVDTFPFEINPPAKLKDANKKSVNIWDFAGDQVYYRSHQLFLSRRTMYFIVWNVEHFSPAEIDAKVCFWIYSLQARIPGAVIQIVANKVDTVTNAQYEDRLARLKRRLKQQETWQKNDLYAMINEEECERRAEQNITNEKASSYAPSSYAISAAGAGDHDDASSFLHSSQHSGFGQGREEDFVGFEGLDTENHLDNDYLEMRPQVLLRQRPHILPHIVPVSAKANTGFDELRAKLSALVYDEKLFPYAGTQAETPASWSLIECALDQLRYERKALPVCTVAELAARANKVAAQHSSPNGDTVAVTDGDAQQCVVFLQSIGEVVLKTEVRHFMQGMVFLDPKWVVDCINRVVDLKMVEQLSKKVGRERMKSRMDIRKHETEITTGVKLLRDKGVLSESLMEKLWPELFLTRNGVQIKYPKVYAGLVGVLEHFDVLCPLTSIAKNGSRKRRWLVPCIVTKKINLDRRWPSLVAAGGSTAATAVGGPDADDSLRTSTGTALNSSASVISAISAGGGVPKSAPFTPANAVSVNGEIEIGRNFVFTRFRPPGIMAKVLARLAELFDHSETRIWHDAFILRPRLVGRQQIKILLHLHQESDVSGSSDSDDSGATSSDYGDDEDPGELGYEFDNERAVLRVAVRGQCSSSLYEMWGFVRTLTEVIESILINEYMGITWVYEVRCPICLSFLGQNDADTHAHSFQLNDVEGFYEEYEEEVLDDWKDYFELQELGNESALKMLRRTSVMSHSVSTSSAEFDAIDKLCSITCEENDAFPDHEVPLIWLLPPPCSKEELQRLSDQRLKEEQEAQQMLLEQQKVQDNPPRQKQGLNQNSDTSFGLEPRLDIDLAEKAIESGASVAEREPDSDHKLSLWSGALLDARVVCRVGVYSRQKQAFVEQGTGFVIDRHKGLIVTACHLISKPPHGDRKFDLESCDSVHRIIIGCFESIGAFPPWQYEAQVVAAGDTQHNFLDAMVLRVTHQVCELSHEPGFAKSSVRGHLQLERVIMDPVPLPLPAEITFGNSEDIKPGDSVVLAGYPLCRGETICLSQGNCVGVTIGWADLHANCWHHNGSSGGPLINADGEVVGLMSHSTSGNLGSHLASNRIIPLVKTVSQF